MPETEHMITERKDENCSVKMYYEVRMFSLEAGQRQLEVVGKKVSRHLHLNK